MEIRPRDDRHQARLDLLGMLRAHGVTHAGLVRPRNEDAFAIERELGLYLVADGMGGHNAGEVAAGLVVETVRTFVARSADGDDFTWPYGIDPRLSFDANRLRTALKLANRRIFRTSEARDDYTGMGSTAVAILVRGGRMTFGSIGDSRLYESAGGELVQLTVDDTWSNHVRAAAPGAPPGALANSSMRNVLTKALGAAAEIDFEVHERKVPRGSRLLLCSDGLYNMAEEGTLGSTLAAETDVVAAAQTLLCRALQGGGRDNVTVLVLDCGE